MAQVLTTPLKNEIGEFLAEFGEELEACSFDAFELLEQLKQEPEEQQARKLFQEFLWDHADDLDVCNPDAFDVIYELVQRMEMEV